MSPPLYGSTCSKGCCDNNDNSTNAIPQNNKEERNRLTTKESTATSETSADCDSCADVHNNNVPSNLYVLNVAFGSFVGFMALQAFFALIANSQSMLADSEAMSVDAFTYLFNMCAERIKNRPPTEAELLLPLAVREHRIEMKRLYLELIPPLISVTTLIIVTITVTQQAWGTLVAEANGDEPVPDVNAGLMLVFSGLNLLLDVVNVTCFARAHQAYGLQNTYDIHCKVHQPETTHLLAPMDENDDDDIEKQNSESLIATTITEDHETRDSLYRRFFGKVNLNMCSAWTHICADTMRSTAVLIAAAIAFLFDSVTPAAADSWAAIVVSITILISLIPLLRGLFATARQIVIESKNKPAFVLET